MDSLYFVNTNKGLKSLCKPYCHKIHTATLVGDSNKFAILEDADFRGQYLLDDA